MNYMHVWFHSHEMFRTDKSTETESRLVVVKGPGQGKRGVTANIVTFGWWKCLEAAVDNVVNVLNVTKLFMSKLLLSCYVYFASVICFIYSDFSTHNWQPTAGARGVGGGLQQAVALSAGEGMGGTMKHLLITTQTTETIDLASFTTYINSRLPMGQLCTSPVPPQRKLTCVIKSHYLDTNLRKKKILTLVLIFLPRF